MYHKSMCDRVDMLFGSQGQDRGSNPSPERICGNCTLLEETRRSPSFCQCTTWTSSSLSLTYIVKDFLYSDFYVLA